MQHLSSHQSCYALPLHNLIWDRNQGSLLLGIFGTNFAGNLHAFFVVVHLDLNWNQPLQLMQLRKSELKVTVLRHFLLKHPGFCNTLENSKWLLSILAQSFSWNQLETLIASLKKESLRQLQSDHKLIKPDNGAKILAHPLSIHLNG